ncbi:MAG: hypothetical protein UDO63_04520 [Oscillospiraceae bacterium]
MGFELSTVKPALSVVKRVVPAAVKGVAELAKNGFKVGNKVIVSGNPIMAVVTTVVVGGVAVLSAREVSKAHEYANREISKAHEEADKRVADAEKRTAEFYQNMNDSVNL